MTPERWRQVESIVAQALSRNASSRSMFLEAACAGDEELRHEVESLLAQETGSGETLSAVVGGAAALFQSSALGLKAEDRIGVYRIIGELGRGGMGEVWLAEDTKLGRRVAVKFLVPGRDANDTAFQRFQEEARAASALNHPNIITIYDAGEDRGRQYIVTEYIQGKTVRSLVESGPLEQRQAISLVRQAAEALDAAHRAGIIHRDIKPENLMLREDGYLKVLDFGLAKLARGSNGDTSAGLTASGMVVGTVAYMSPEQARGKEADTRSDLFSLGAVFYEMLSGRRAFPGRSSIEMLGALLECKPEPLHNLVKTSKGVSRIVARLLAKDREARFQSAAELIAALAAEGPATGRPISRRALVAGASGVVGAAAGAYWWWNDHWQVDLSKVRTRRLSVPDDVDSAALSDDGNRIAFVRRQPRQWSLWIGPSADVKEAVQVGDWRPGVGRIECLHPSGADACVSTSISGVSGIWKFPLSGGAPELLLEGGFVGLSFNPDGRRLAFGRLRDPTTDIAVARSDGKEERILFAGGTGVTPSGPVWSLDGRQVMFTVTTKNGASARYETRSAAEGEGKSTVVARSSAEFTYSNVIPIRKDVLLCLGRETDSQREGVFVLLSGNRRQRVILDENSYGSIWSDGRRKRFLTIAHALHGALWLAEHDSGWPPRPDDAWRRRQLKADGCWRTAPLFVGPGRILYSSIGDDGRWMLRRIDPDGGQEGTVAGDAQILDLAASEDGALVFYTLRERDLLRVWRMGTDGSDRRPLTPGPFDMNPSVSGGEVFFRAWSTSRAPSNVMRIPVDGGTPQIFLQGVSRPPIFSRDGRMAAVFQLDPLSQRERLSIRTVPESKLVREMDNLQARNIDWSPDGSGLIYTRLLNGQQGLWYHPIPDGQPRCIAELGSEPEVFARLSKDGRRLAYVAAHLANHLILIDGLS